ncbi:hypothetical protein [Roseibium marinum]|uniref:Hpr(Ser) kinase/phosphatase n=1 Tax=Roseibium marinum TaxID=281252 RepID=A0A2S3UPM8_9HYPH|nr:hypothetical protein [Roseibium marinum]POF29677.1 hypothetical protein CLV41_108101 [Roseibium marinum]
MRGVVQIKDPGRLAADLFRRLPERLDLDIYGTRIVVKATSSRALRRLRLVYGAFLARDQGPADARLALVELDHAPHGWLAEALRPDDPLRIGGGHFLVADWLPFALSLRDETLLHYYASKFLRLHLVACHQPDHLTLHAASLDVGGGHGILLVGEAASGKTTLTLQLLDRGMSFCSDDTTVIRRRDRKCVPFPLAFILRGGPDGEAPDIPGVRERKPDLELLDEPRWLVQRNGDAGKAFTPVAIFFLHSRADRQPGCPVPMNSAEAAMELLRNKVVPMGLVHEDVAVMTADFHLVCDLANSAQCLSVNSTDLARTRDSLLSHISGFAAVPA